MNILGIRETPLCRLTARTRISRPGPVLSRVRTRTGRDFFSVGWDRTRFFFGGRGQDQIFFDGMGQDQTFFWWDETGPDFFLVGGTSMDVSLVGCERAGCF